MRSSSLALLVLLTACAPTPPQPFTPEDVSFAATPEQVWQALTLVYTDLNIPIGNMDRASWFLRSGEMVDPPGERNNTFFNCGEGVDHDTLRRGPRAENLNVHSTITTLLIPSSSGTAVRTRLNAVGQLPGVQQSTCVSTGEFERRIVEALRARL